MSPQVVPTRVDLDCPPTIDDVAPTAFLDHGSSAIRGFVERVTGGAVDPVQQAVRLFEAVRDIRAENRRCVDEETNKVLEGWRADKARTVLGPDQVDRSAFIAKAESYFKTYYTGANLALYQSIRASA